MFKVFHHGVRELGRDRAVDHAMVDRQRQRKRRRRDDLTVAHDRALLDGAQPRIAVSG